MRTISLTWPPGLLPSTTSRTFNSTPTLLQHRIQTANSHVRALSGRPPAATVQQVTFPTVKLATPRAARPTTPRHKTASRAEILAGHFSPSSSFSTSSNSQSVARSNLADSSMAYTSRRVAAPHTLEHRVYIEKDGMPVSPFHDVPLYANAQQTVLNMIVEVPRWTNAKMEVC